MFFDALEEGGPFHEVGHVKAEIIVFGVGVQVAKIEMEEIGGLNAADDGHVVKSLPSSSAL